MSSDNSFDPKSWTRADASPTAGTKRSPEALPSAWSDVLSESPASEAPQSDKRARVGGRRSGLLVATVAGLALAAGGYWFLGRPRTHGPVVVTVPGEQEATLAHVNAPEANVSHRRLVLASASDLLPALLDAGLEKEEAAAVNKAAMAVIGSARSEIQALMTIVTSGKISRLDRLEVSLPDGSGAVVARGEAGEWQASRVAADLSKAIKVVRGEMDTNSFYSSAVAAGVVDLLIPEFVNAFSFDFDLQHEVSPGDRFEVAFEQTLNPDGKPVGPPQLLYASLVTATKSRSLYRYKPVDQEVGWFDGNGASSVRSLMRTPVDGARISSKFGFRLHPVLHYMKLHRGTDFAAPTGTPIYASGDATVEFAAMKGANGNLTVLRHDNGWRTLYLHQSRFMPDIAPGVRVTQGQKIGEVGTTGRSTGPHLHYEVHIDGEAVDPQSIRTEAGRKALEGSARKAFLLQRDRVDVARARQAE